MTADTKQAIRVVFKRMETDVEFKGRLQGKEIDLHPPWGTIGEELDIYAWNNRQVQRRIVEDEA